MTSKLNRTVTDMKIQALKFPAAPPGLPPVRALLESESAEELAGAREKGGTAAYVIQAKDLGLFRKFDRLVIDRGVKHKASGLARYLLGKSGIPLIEGSYVDAGQLKRSIRTLLANALERGERNLYLVGTGHALFGAMWDEAGRPLPAKVAAPKEGPATELLLDMLDGFEEPGDLASRFVGESSAARLVRQLILRAAHSDCRVLILGESGTGKEIVARTIHDYSARREGKFIPVNCGAIPEALFESEVFGTLKGSFTSAVDRMGLWEIADRGTLFLDEVGDLSLAHQAKILRVLEDGRIREVGSRREKPVTARVIAATHRDLFSMVESGQFREDLYYRLREFQILAPALRDHLDDLPALAQTLWKRITGEEGNPLSGDIVRELQKMRWPGNARELRTVLGSLRVTFGAEGLRPEHLRTVFLLQGQVSSPRGRTPSGRRTTLHRIECLSHLRRVEEVIRAGEVSIRPVLRSRRGDVRSLEALGDIVRLRLGELEVLCTEPLLFHDESVFSSVNRLKGILAYFQDLLRNNVKEALRYLKKDVASGMRVVQKDLAGELKLLLAGTS